MFIFIQHVLPFFIANINIKNNYAKSKYFFICKNHRCSPLPSHSQHSFRDTSFHIHHTLSQVPGEGLQIFHHRKDKKIFLPSFSFLQCLTLSLSFTFALPHHFFFCQIFFFIPIIAFLGDLAAFSRLSRDHLNLFDFGL